MVWGICISLGRLFFCALHTAAGITRAQADTRRQSYMALSIYGSSYTPFFSNRAYTRVARMRAAITARRSAADAPAGPGVAVGHSQANPSPPGAASGPYGKPNSGNLAPARSRVARVHDWRPRGCLPTSPTAAEGIRRASRTPSTLPPPVLPLPAACASVRPACLAALCGQPDRHHWHTAAVLRRRWVCASAGVCASAANGAG